MVGLKLNCLKKDNLHWFLSINTTIHNENLPYQSFNNLTITDLITDLKPEK